MVRTPVCWIFACALAACGFPRPERVGECMTAADCVSADEPFCVASTCVAACASNADCALTAATPLCQASTGACVACLDDSVCAADKPVCDATAGACRGCSADDECASGVCLDADGTCASEGDVVYVQQNRLDQGDCTRSEPCGSLPYALSKVIAKRRVISVTAGQVFLSAALAIDRDVYIDANGTVLNRPGIVLSVPAATSVTLSNMMLSTESGDPRVVATVSATGALRIFNSTIAGQLSTNGGGISVVKSRLVNPLAGNAESLVCMGGTVTATESRFERAVIDATNCQVTVTKSRFEMAGNRSVIVSGGFVRLENSVITNSDNGADSLYVVGVAPGSVVRFNTIVSTSGAPSDGAALYADGSVVVTSNVFAYDSMHPLGGSPSVRYSLFDATAVAAQTGGPGNQAGDVAKFFVDRSRRDFHLSASSPARGKAEPGVSVGDDLDGQMRPATADVGAYQYR